MKPEVAARIKRDFVALGDADPALTPEFQEAEKAEGAGYRGVWRIHGPLTMCPVLFMHRGALRSAQEHVFGFYLVRRAFRGVLLGVNHQVAALHALDEKLYGPAVVLAYSAAFHALHTVLALRGRAFLDSFFWPLTSQSEREPQAAIATLTRRAKWVIEGRLRSHTKRWLEVAKEFDTCPDELPPAFRVPFEYYYAASLHRAPPEVEALFPDRGPPPTLADSLSRVLVAVAESRHTALYQTFGSDPQVVEDLVNKDRFDSMGIEQHAAMIIEFAGELMMWAAENLAELASTLEAPPELRKALFLGVHQPWFDSPRIDTLPSEAASVIGLLNEWLIDGVR